MRSFWTSALQRGAPATAIAGLASRLGDGHDFQQMTVGIFKIESAASAASIDAFVLMAKRAAAVSDAFSFHAGKDCFIFRLADMECVMMALASAGIEARTTP